MSIENQKINKNSLGNLIFNFYLWRLVLIYLSIQIAFYGLIYFLPTQVASLLGRKVGFMVSLVTAMPWVTAVLGTWFIPRYADRHGGGTKIKIAALTLFLAGIGVAVSSSASPLLAMAALCFSGLCFLSCGPVFWSITTQVFSGTELAGLIGFINMCGTGAGGFLAPILRVEAESVFESGSAGLLILGGVAVVRAFLMAYNLRVRTH